MTRLEIVRKPLSPVWLKIIASLILLATIYKIISLTFFDVSLVTYLILNLIALIIWTGQEIVVIDFDGHKIKDGFRILGLTYLETTVFNGCERIFINKVKTAETVRHLATTIDVHHERYKAFLKTTDGDKICIGVSRNKEELITKIKLYNSHLRTMIIDNTAFESVLLS